MNLSDDEMEFRRETERRLRDLEGGQRTGLATAGMITASGSTTVTATSSAAWQDVTGTELTVHCNYGAIVIASFRATRIGNRTAAGGFYDHRSYELVAGVSLDGYAPHLHPSGVNFQAQVLAMAQDAATKAETNIFGIPTTVVRVVKSLEPGDHVFKMQAYSTTTNAGGTVDPVASDAVLVVIPL